MFTTRDYRQYSAISILHTFQFTVAHTPGFSVFTSRILATDLSQSHCNFKSHMKPSFRSLIPFLPLFGSYQLNSIPSSSPRSLESRNSTRLLRLLCSAKHVRITTLHGPRRKNSLYCWEGLFTDPLSSNWHPIVACVRLCGNVFTESLPSNGSTCHNMKYKLQRSF
jgi:hypothetical protein